MECKVFRLKRIRAQIRRLLPLLFLFLAFLIMVLIRLDNPAVVRTRSIIWECFAPIISVVRQPVYWVKNGADGLKDWAFTYHENEALKKEIINLVKIHFIADIQKSEKELEDL